MINNIFTSFCLILLVGCANAPFEKTTMKTIDSSKPKIDKTITIGVIIDNRFPFWPRGEAHPPLVKKGEKQVKDFEPLPVTREVLISMGEVRSQLAYALKKSRRFNEIINPPIVLTGETLPDMLKKALETSDYLIVGEVNSFDTKNLGRNNLSFFTYPIDFTILALPNLLMVLTKNPILMTVALPVSTSECLFSMSLTIYSVETGRAITTSHIEESALLPVEGFDYFGDNFYDKEDDGIFLGRRLGKVALTNACIQAVEEMAKVIQKDIQKTSQK